MINKKDKPIRHILQKIYELIIQQCRQMKESVGSMFRVTFFATQNSPSTELRKVLFNWAAEQRVQKLPWEKNPPHFKAFEK